MEAILREAEAALDAGLYYAALVVCMTIPDVGAALASPDGKSSTRKYKAWFEANTAKHLAVRRLTTDDCWEFRCALLHEGTAIRKYNEVARIMFLGPPNESPSNRFEDALQIGLMHFCRGMIAAGREWLASEQSNPLVQHNLRSLVQYYPNGIPPYLVGLPVIG